MSCRVYGRYDYARMKLLLDVNITLKYAALLAERGVEALRWSDVGAMNELDSEIMDYAFENDFIVLTCDLDFGTILSVTHNLKPSVIQVRASAFYAERAMDLIAAALSRFADDLQKGAILPIDIKKARSRLLPL